jgi:hypothetical protein
MNLSLVLILVEPHDPDGGLARSLSLVDPIVMRGSRLLRQPRRRSPILTHRASLIRPAATRHPRKKSIQNP